MAPVLVRDEITLAPMPDRMEQPLSPLGHASKPISVCAEETGTCVGESSVAKSLAIRTSQNIHGSRCCAEGRLSTRRRLHDIGAGPCVASGQSHPPTCVWLQRKIWRTLTAVTEQPFAIDTSPSRFVRYRHVHARRPWGRVALELGLVSIAKIAFLLMVWWLLFFPHASPAAAARAIAHRLTASGPATPTLQR